MRVKALIPTLRKHIPGNPTLVIEYMDGGGGRKGANYLFRNAKPDGLTVGAMSGAKERLTPCRDRPATRPWNGVPLECTAVARKIELVWSTERRSYELVCMQASLEAGGSAAGCGGGTHPL